MKIDQVTHFSFMYAHTFVKYIMLILAVAPEDVYSSYCLS